MYNSASALRRFGASALFSAPSKNYTGVLSMKISQLSILVLTVFAVAACSSSGSSSTTKPSTGTPTTKPSNNQNNKPGNNQGAGGADAVVSGNILKIDQNNKKDSLVVNKPHSSTAVNTLEVDGQKFDIMLLTGPFLHMQDHTYKRDVGGTNLSYSRFGMITLREKGIDYLFAQGTETKNMPTTGIAKYQGRAVYGNRELDKDAGKESYNMMPANSSFDVDFGKKTVTGTISNAEKKFADISLSAKIDGNRFEGVKDNYTTKGGFYGPDAAEMAGTFVSKDYKSGGAFGATKQ